MYNVAKAMPSPRYKDKSLGLSLMSTSGLMYDFLGLCAALEYRVGGLPSCLGGALAVY